MPGRTALPSVLAALLVAALALSACGSSKHGIPAGAVAAVEGRPITEAEVHHWLGVAAYSNAAGTVLEKHPEVPEPPDYTECITQLQALAREEHTHPLVANLKRACDSQYHTLRNHAVSFLVNVNSTFAETDRLGLEISSGEIDSEYAKLKARLFPTPAALAALRARTRQTEADLRLHAKLSLAQEKLQHHILAGVAQPTDAQINAYYNANKSQFAPKETRDVRVILVREVGKAQEALRELHEGKSFAAVANKRSIERTSRENGGLIPGMTRESGTPQLVTAAFAARPGQLGGPVNTVVGYYVYEVARINPPRTLTSAELHAKVKSLLYEKKAEAALQAFASEFSKRWKAQTECRPGFIVPECKQYAGSAG